MTKTTTTTCGDWEEEMRGWLFHILSYLPRSVDDLRRKFLSFVFDHLAKGILDGGVVTLDEVSIDELNRERRFA